MKRYPYSERDYTFGQMMLTLRTTIGLTQAGLGERLGVSRRAVAEWEAGLSYPKAERLTFFSETPPAAFPASLEQRITQLVARLQASRCLLVLDNLETLLASRDPEGGYLPGYEGYGRLIARLAEAAHQSCVLLTSREKPKEIEPLEGVRSPVRSLRLSGMDEQAARVLLADKELSGTSLAWQRLVAGYAGNPLALKIVGQAVSDLFGGDLDRFLQEGELVFNGVRPVLRQQVGRLSALEHLLLTWLAVLREWTELPALAHVLHPRVLRARLLEALEALSRRSLVERGQQASFSLQSVVMEFLTDELGENLSEEIVLGNPQQLRRVALSQAQAKDYVRQTQVRLLVHPLLERRRSELGADSLVEEQLLRQLSQFRAENAATQGYGPANVICLLTALRGHLRGLDLSRLSIRGAYLQGVDMQDTNLARAQLEECVFSETFDAITAVATSLTGLYWAAGSRRGEVRVWREAGQIFSLVWQAHTDLVMALAFSPDERTLASASFDGSVKLWDVESGAPLWTVGPINAVLSLAFAPDGRTLASGGYETTVRLWDAQRGTPFEDLPHPDAVWSVAFSPDGRLLASGDDAGTIRLWERQQTGSARLWQTLAEHTNWVRGLAFAPDGSILASASWDGTVKLWELASGRCVQTLEGHTERVYCVAWSPDGGTLASGSFDHTIRLWDVRRGRSRVMLLGHSAVVNELAFTPDSLHLLSGSDDGTLRLWEVQRGQCVRVLQGYDACLYDLAWSPDATRLASAGTDTQVTIWEVASGMPRGVLGGHRWTVYGVGWSPDGSRLASAGWDNAIRLWEPATGTCVQILRDLDHPDTVFWGLAWSPDGTRLVGGAEDGHVYVWDASDGRLLARLAGHHGGVTSVAWSPDGTRLAWSPGGAGLLSGGSDGMLRWWELPSGQCVRMCKAHQGTIQALKVSPGGRRLASCGDDGTIRLWGLESGQSLGTLRRDRPYERLNITGIRGLTQAEITTLRALGAVEDEADEQSSRPEQAAQL